MAWLFAAATATWLAALCAMAACLLPAAAVAKLLPARRARLAALAWLSVAAVGVVAAIATGLSLPIWAAYPLRYTPHLERPLPHLCFVAIGQMLGEDTLRVGSVVAAALWLLGGVRLVLGALSSHAMTRRARALGRPLPNPFGERVLSLGAATPAGAYRPSPLVAHTVGVLRPVVVVSPPAPKAEPEAVAAVLVHELDHVAWRDPMVGLVLSAAALSFPGLGWLIARQWRLYAERAADLVARRRAGELAFARAVELVTPAGRSRDVSYEVRRGAATDDAPTESLAPAASAAVGWVLLLAALWPTLYPRVLMTIVCAFEAMTSAWS